MPKDLAFLALVIISILAYKTQSQLTLQSTANRCTSAQYFDTTTLECKTCPENLQPDSNSKIQIYKSI